MLKSHQVECVTAESRSVRERLRTVWSLVLCVIAVLGLGACVKEVPLPPDIKVVEPVGIAPKYAAFSGKWRGSWTDGKAILVVEKIDPDGADVAYGYVLGSRAGSWRARAEFKGAELIVYSPEYGATFTFRSETAKMLSATRSFGSTSVDAVFKRIAHSN